MFSALNVFDNSNDYRTTALKRAQDKNLAGRTVIVTGANGALGKEICLALLTTGVTVVGTARSLGKMEDAKEPKNKALTFPREN